MVERANLGRVPDKNSLTAIAILDSVVFGPLATAFSVKLSKYFIKKLGFVVACIINRAPSRLAGAGEMICEINSSATSIADLTSNGRASMPIKRRTKFVIVFTNRLHADTGLPSLTLIRIAASCAWKSGLEKASATNSSNDCVP